MGWEWEWERETRSKQAELGNAHTRKRCERNYKTRELLETKTKDRLYGTVFVVPLTLVKERKRKRTSHASRLFSQCEFFLLFTFSPTPPYQHRSLLAL